jgi:hypothetical protein
MLFVALLTIGMLAAVQNIESQIKRDREEELIHRGVQYSRAVRHYFKKFGRYPNRIEELENTNNIRFLRKRYKDPLTGKDFKPLHMTDVQMSFSGVPGGGLPPAGLNGPAAGGLNAPPSGRGAVVQDPTAGAAQNAQGGDQAGGDQSGGSEQTNVSTGGTTAESSSQKSEPSTASNQLTSQTFGGGAIVGVASVSKDKTIREFNKKNHYNQWQFIYDPTTDRGGLLMTPNQPPLQGSVAVNPANGPPGTTPGQNPSVGTGPQPGPGNSPMQPNPQPPDQ